jgi:hypothetical protein
MVKAITKYAARDGSEWRNEADAATREALLDEVEAVMRPLGERPKLDSRQYVQHHPATVISCRVEILKLCARELPDYEVFRHEPPEDVHPRSIAGRILDDCGGPLSEAWGRFACIDAAGREWQQPYFVAHTPADAVPA